MADHLLRLLGAKDSGVASYLNRLEAASNNQSLDVRLSAEIIGKAHIGVKSLGLDPRDSSAREVYAGITDTLKRHNGFLQKQMGLSENATTIETITAVHSFIDKLHIPKQVWALKHSKLKRLLTEKPPRRAMKALGYRSVASMMKREPAPHVLAVALYTESDAWKARYYEQYQAISHLDFEVRDVQFCLPTSRHWSELGARMSSDLQDNIISLKEVGAIVLLPIAQNNIKGVCIALTALLLVQAEELRVYSSYLKLHQMHANFGAILHRAVSSVFGTHVPLFGETMHWKSLHAHFSRDDAILPDFFEPHVSVEDLSWRKAEEVLSSIEPALSFWQGNDYVGGFYGSDQQPISFNLLDAIVNYSNGIACEHRVISHMQSALWDELLMRYIGSNHIRSLVLRHLNDGFIETDEILHEISVSARLA